MSWLLCKLPSADKLDCSLPLLHQSIPNHPCKTTTSRSRILNPNTSYAAHWLRGKTSHRELATRCGKYLLCTHVSKVDMVLPSRGPTLHGERETECCPSGCARGAVASTCSINGAPYLPSMQLHRRLWGQASQVPHAYITCTDTKGRYNALSVLVATLFC
jgi:hypothetical protein